MDLTLGAWRSFDNHDLGGVVKLILLAMLILLGALAWGGMRLRRLVRIAKAVRKSAQAYRERYGAEARSIIQERIEYEYDDGRRRHLRRVLTHLP